MKTSISYAFFAAAVACGFAQAQTTAYTTPVGYTTTVIPAQSDTVISVPLQTATAWSGVSTGISGNTIQVAAASFVAGQFVYVPVTQTKTFMVQVTSGTLTGRFFQVTANATNSVTVDPVGSNSLQAQGFGPTTNFVIRPYWTLSTLFPGGGAIGPSPFDAPVNQVFITFNSPQGPVGVNKSSTNQYYFDNGADNTFPFNGTPQWADQNFNAANDVIINPANGISIRNQTNSPLSIVTSGTVQTVSTGNLVVSDVTPNDNVVQQPYPLNMTLNNSGLISSGAVLPTTDYSDPTDLVLVYNPLGTGFNPSAAKVYNYITDPAAVVDLGITVPGWYDASFAPAGNDLLPSGGGIVIRKKQVASMQANTWTPPLPFTP